jgi:parallel beta helix pectate lyase-like protein
MKTSKSLVISLLITLAAALPAAAVPRVFVSGLGNDANPGSLTSPKRSFASALTVTDPGGEIIVLDSAGYGPVTINQSVSIICPLGVYAGITTTGPDAITVSAGPGGVVVLHGLTLKAAGIANSGIHITSAGAVHIESCVISGFAHEGIFVELSSGAPGLFVKDTICRNNGSGLNSTDSGTANVSIDHCRFEANQFDGVDAGANKEFTVRDSVAAGNGGVGFSCSGGGDLNIVNCSITENGNGVSASGLQAHAQVSDCTVTSSSNVGLGSGSGGTVTAANTTIMRNGTGLSAGSGGNLFTYGNNKLQFNGTDGSFTGTFSFQ